MRAFVLVQAHLIMTEDLRSRPLEDHHNTSYKSMINQLFIIECVELKLPAVGGTSWEHTAPAEISSLMAVHNANPTVTVWCNYVN